MFCFRTGTSQGKKYQATPTKQDLGTSYGFLSKFPTSILVLFQWGSPPPHKDSSLIQLGGERDWESMVPSEKKKGLNPKVVLQRGVKDANWTGHYMEY